MMDWKNRLFIFLVSVILFSCNSALNPQDYGAWISQPENGLRKGKEINGLTFETQYKPSEFLALQKLKKGEYSEEAYDKYISEYQDHYYFDLKIDVSDGSKDILAYNINSQYEQQLRIHYLSFGMKNDIYLISGNDTLPCMFYHFERGFGLTSHRNFMLGFPVNQEFTSETKTLVLDTEEFGTGPVKIAILEEDLKNLPELKI